MATKIAAPMAGTDARDRPMAHDSSPIMVGTNISKTFNPPGREPVIALKNLDFFIKPGEFISLVGPSGCGKSTLLNICGSIIPPSTGTLKYKDTEVRQPRREIQMMFQQPVLFPWRTVYQNLMLPIEIRHEDKSAYHKRALTLLEILGLKDFAKSYPWELSGGMQQRAALGRLLLQNPEMLLLDEPFGSLDEFTREALNLELLRLWQDSGKAVLFVTHSIPEAVFMADRVFIFTCRPGRMAKIIEVNLPRPRFIDMMHEQKFQDLVFEVRNILREASGQGEIK
jgi:NitT/TauT family transport system ATP-binding protein